MHLMQGILLRSNNILVLMEWKVGAGIDVRDGDKDHDYCRL